MASGIGDLLDPAAILSQLPNILPPSSKQLKSAYDGIAALIHTVMCAVGFRLIAVNDVSLAHSISANVLPDEWNSRGPGDYTFRYRHEQSSLEFVLKIAKLGTRTLINAIAVESEKVALLDISTNDFVSPSFYPYDFTSSDAPLVHGFISSNRVADLISQFKPQIIQKLIPGLQKEGYVEETSSRISNNPESTSVPQPARPYPQAPPQSPEYVSPNYISPVNPFQVGRRDLDPIIDQHPFAPRPIFTPDRSGDGMFVGPDHSIFGQRRGDRRPAPLGPWGGDGYLPMPVPPGVRFDPVLPFPPTGGTPGGRVPGGGGGRFGNSYDPRSDLMPPGMEDMFG